MNEQELKIEQEHKDFLRKVANEVYELIRNPATVTRFREQVKLFCEKNEEHQREIELLEKASLADSKLQEAIKKKERKMWGKTWEEMTEGEKDSIDPDPIGFHVAKLEGFEHYVYHKDLKNVDDTKGHYYYWFWGPPAKTACLLEFSTPPPDRDGSGSPDYWSFEFSKEPDDNEKLICCYAVLAAIHDIQISDKPIFTAKIYNGAWSLRNKWEKILWRRCIGEYWSAVLDVRIDGLSDTRDWITRTLNDVKADLASSGKADLPNEKSADINIQNSNVILGDVHQPENLQIGDNTRIQKYSMIQKIGIGIIGTIAALLTILHLLGLLEPIKAFISKILLHR